MCVIECITHNLHETSRPGIEPGSSAWQAEILIHCTIETHIVKWIGHDFIKLGGSETVCNDFDMLGLLSGQDNVDSFKSFSHFDAKN